MEPNYISVDLDEFETGTAIVQGAADTERGAGDDVAVRVLSYTLAAKAKPVTFQWWSGSNNPLSGEITIKAGESISADSQRGLLQTFNGESLYLCFQGDTGISGHIVIQYVSGEDPPTDHDWTGL